MPIKLKKGDAYFYAGAEILNTEAKERADKILSETERKFRILERKQAVTKQDILSIWHEKGKLANEIISNWHLSESEKKYFWVMLHDVSGETTPARANKVQNDFQVASRLAKYSLYDLREVGSWGLWREILGSSKMKDERVTDWLAPQVLKGHFKSHKEVRPLLKMVRNRLKRLNTSVLSDRELFEKLDEIRN